MDGFWVVFHRVLVGGNMSLRAYTSCFEDSAVVMEEMQCLM
jgi:hypothetical protein